MRKSLVMFLVTAAVLASGRGAADARSPLRVGVADDAAKYAEDGGTAFFAQMHDLGMATDGIMVGWDASRPAAILEPDYLAAVVAQAELEGIELVFAVRPLRARAIGESAVRAAQFARYLALLARTYPSVRTFVVGNEPNQPRFWQPQYRKGQAVAAAAYERMLARAYDALKAVDQEIVVAGGALSSRGNDYPAAPSNPSRSPVRFLADLGRAYRASHRARPIMDVLAFHPYPRSFQDPLSKGLQWPGAGFANLGRVKQAVWDAFHGTAQPTVEDGLKIMISEVGWQVATPVGSDVYVGAENVAVTTEAHQAAVYGQIVRAAACDASISHVLILPLVDERNLAGFQSGVVRADGTERPAYGVQRTLLARTGGRCSGKATSWRHVTGVVGATAMFRGLARPKTRIQRAWSFSIRSGEGVTYSAEILRAAPPSAPRLASVVSAARDGVVLRTRGAAKANWTPLVRFPRRSLAPGRYRFRVELRAETNAGRRRTFVSRTFVVR